MRSSWLLRLGALCALLMWLAGPASASPSYKTVTYRGYTVRVPSTWPVVDLRKSPSACVRLDARAVYLGRPAADELCPAHAVGHRRAILLEPTPHGARAVGDAGSAGAKQQRTTAHTASAVYTGKGVDVCAAPSRSTMSAWSSSPYRAIGVYVGGENMGCAQPNLTPNWVSTETAAGWHLIPTYVGKQGPGNGCGCSPISSSQAAAQGRAAADDAVSNVSALGIPAGNPIYYDMEAYSSGGSNTSTVLSFLSAWTSRLHAHGYTSGVYSSGASGIADLVHSVSSHSITEPDDIWVADWNGKATTSDPYVPSGDWSHHERIHQYSGGHNETYGGRTLNVDNDYLDAATADTHGAASAPPSTPPGGLCVVPRLNHKTLRQARLALHRANCKLGNVHRPKHRRRHRRLRVFSQIPKGGTQKPAGFAVPIRLAY